MKIRSTTFWNRCIFLQAIHPCYNDAVIIQPIYRCEIPQVISEVLKEIIKNQLIKITSKKPSYLTSTIVSVRLWSFILLILISVGIWVSRNTPNTINEGLVVLWGQWIKLIQVASNSKLRKNQRNDLLFLKLFPLIASGPQKPKKLTTSKIKYESFGSKILIPR